MSMKGNFARSMLCSLVTRVDLGWYSSIVGVRDSCEAGCFGKLASTNAAARVAAACGRTNRKTTAARINARSAMVRQDFIVRLGYGIARPIFPQDAGTPLA